MLDEPLPNSFNADVLAIAAHRDDVEQTCGGTLLRMASRGLRTAILDLTKGEAGTRGSAEDREREAAEAAKLLGVGWREALDLPDGAIENTLENRTKIARHPDHAIVATLGYEACFLAGLSKAPAVRQTLAIRPQEVDVLPQEESRVEGLAGLLPHRPFKIVYASLYADVRPSFVVDITPFIEQRHAALMAYRSQYANQTAGSGLFVAEEEILERTFAEARHYGLLAGVRYGEPFVQKEVGLVDDLTLIPVQSI